MKSSYALINVMKLTFNLINSMKSAINLISFANFESLILMNSVKSSYALIFLHIVIYFPLLFVLYYHTFIFLYFINILLNQSILC